MACLLPRTWLGCLGRSAPTRQAPWLISDSRVKISRSIRTGRPSSRWRGSIASAWSCSTAMQRRPLWRGRKESTRSRGPVRLRLWAVSEGHLFRCDARTFFSAPARGRSAPAIPWVRGGRASHVRRLLWPWLVAPPALTLWLIFRLHEPGPALLLGGAAFAVCGLASVAVGLQALARREKVRAVPLSK